MKNPYKKTIIDELHREEVGNEQYLIWEESRKSALKEAGTVLTKMIISQKQPDFILSTIVDFIKDYLRKGKLPD